MLGFLVLLSAPSVLAQQVGGNSPFVQVELTEEILTRFQQAQLEMADLEFANPRGSFSGDPAEDPELYAGFAQVAQKHGFKDLDELLQVGSTVSLVLTGWDPDTGQFEEPADAMRKELERARTDPRLGEAERQQVIADIEAALPTIPKLEHRQNVEVVRAFFDRLDAATQ